MTSKVVKIEEYTVDTTSIKTILQFIKFNDSEKLDVLIKTCTDIQNPDNKDITFGEYVNKFTYFIDNKHSNKEKQKGIAMFDSCSAKNKKPISSLIKSIISDKIFINKFDIKKLIVFYSKNELWVVTNMITPNIIMQFDDEIYDMMERIKIDIDAIIVGENEVKKNETLYYDEIIEV